MLWNKNADAKSMPKWYARNCMFDGMAVADGMIDLSQANTQFADGDAVMYFSDAPLTGLTNGQVYYLKRHPNFKYEVSLTRGGEAIAVEAVEGNQLFIKYDVAETTEGGTLGYALIAVDKELARKRIGGFVSTGWYRYIKYVTHDGFERAHIDHLVSVKSMDTVAEEPEDIGAGDVNAPEKDVILVADVPLTGVKSVVAKTIKADHLELDSARLALTAEGDVTLKGITTSGVLEKSVSNAAVSVESNDWVEVTDSEIGQRGYNSFEIGLKNSAPKHVVIEGVNFAGTLSNNAILIFAHQENAEILIKDCVFEECSNPLRISNRLNVPANITLENCSFKKWETNSPEYAGAILFQDYTSKTVKEAVEANRFANLTVTMKNCTAPDGSVIKPENVAEVLGTGANQIAYIFTKEGVVPFSEERYPKFVFA